MKDEKLKRLATERSNPCVTISMNTHRTHPDNTTDIIVLKNLLTEASDRIIKEFGKRNMKDLLEKIDSLAHEIDSNYNLESLHIFISNSTYEIIRSTLPTQRNTVHVSNSFAIKPLIRLLNQTVEYFILLLSQSGVKLYFSINETVLQEITNDDFPFSENPHYILDKFKLSDGKQVDKMVGEFFNKIDKAMMKVYNRTGLGCIVICTQDNYSRLMQVAEKPSIYYGYSNINYNDTIEQSLASQAWLIIKNIYNKTIEDAIIEMQNAMGQKQVITNLSEIFRAIKEGKGELLIINSNYQQAVKMTGEFTFELVDDNIQEKVIDDIISEIAWEVITKNGRAIFVNQEDIQSLGSITLKLRY